MRPHSAPHPAVVPSRGRRRRIERRGNLIVLALLCSACVTTHHTQVRVAYTGTAPVEEVKIEALNATGHALPMPPVGLIARAAQFVSGTAAKDEEIIDVFAAAAAAQLRDKHVHAATDSDRPLPQLRISLSDWDVHDATAATGAVVFVTADYQLLDAHSTVLWEATQQRLPMQLSGPTLSRLAVERIASACVERALASFPHPPSGPTR